jgi:hypothetical protein
MVWFFCLLLQGEINTSAGSAHPAISVVINGYDDGCVVARLID